MTIRTLLAFTAFTALFPCTVFSQDTATRPDWDQEKAVALVQKVIAVEETGQPWKKIAWMTDVDAAIARAQKENKPIFLYFSVVKGGPAAAPC